MTPSVKTLTNGGDHPASTALTRMETAAHTKDAAWISQELTTAQDTRYYGRIVLQMEAGMCSRIEYQHSVKPPHRPGP